MSCACRPRCISPSPRTTSSFQSMGVWLPGTASITGIAQPEQVNTALITDGVLETLDVPAAAGQWLTAADQDPRGAQRVMLSYGYWQRRFGGDPGVVGRTISVDSQSRVIAGVMPRGFKVVNYDFDLLVPLAFDPVKQILAGFAYHGIARLRPGVTISQADADVARLLNVWMDSWTNGPGTDPHWYLNWKITPAFQPLKGAGGRQYRQRAVGGDGDDRRGDADRVHQRGQPAAGARRCAPAGACGPLGAGRGTMADCA